MPLVARSVALHITRWGQRTRNMVGTFILGILTGLSCVELVNLDGTSHGIDLALALPATSRACQIVSGTGPREMRRHRRLRLIPVPLPLLPLALDPTKVVRPLWSMYHVYRVTYFAFS